MEVRIDRDNCIGCGLCEELCPEVFALDDEYIATVKKQPTQLTDNLQEAADSCPTGAIEITE